MILYLRHAYAGERDQWTEPDHLRPLQGIGPFQASKLAVTLGGWPWDAITSSPFTRCTQTVDPLATHVGLPIIEASEFAEGSSPEMAIAFARTLGLHVVACSHGDVLGAIVGMLAAEGYRMDSSLSFEKSAGWFVDHDARSAVYVPPPC